MHKDIKKILLSHDEIVSRTKELAKQITNDYQGEKPPIFIALLKGSIPFLAELIQHVDLDIEYDFMAVSSYEGTHSLGNVKIEYDLNRNINGESIVLVEDIVDTGNTIKEVKRMLHNKGAKDVKVVSLLDKPSRREVAIEADYIGFEIPNEFVVGYGLDYNQKYRNLAYIAILKEEAYS